MPRVAADQAGPGPRSRSASWSRATCSSTTPTPPLPTYISHVAIYLGNGWMIQAPEPGLRVQVVPVDFGCEFAGAIQGGSPPIAAAVAGGAGLTARPCRTRPGARHLRRSRPTAWSTGVRGRNHHYMSTRQEIPDGRGGRRRRRRWRRRRRTAARAPRRRCGPGSPAGSRPAGSPRPPDVQVDREEITVVGTLADPAAAGGLATPSAPPRPRAGSAGSARRPGSQRIEIAREAEHRFRRKVVLGSHLRRP